MKGNIIVKIELDSDVDPFIISSKEVPVIVFVDSSNLEKVLIKTLPINFEQIIHLVYFSMVVSIYFLPVVDISSNLNLS